MSKKRNKSSGIPSWLAVSYWFNIFWIANSVTYLEQSGFAAVLPWMKDFDARVGIGFPLTFYFEEGYSGVVQYDPQNAITDLGICLFLAFILGFCSKIVCRRFFCKIAPLEINSRIRIVELLFGVILYSVICSVVYFVDGVFEFISTAILPIIPTISVIWFYVAKRKVFWPLFVFGTSFLILPNMVNFAQSDNLLRSFALWPVQIFVFLQIEVILAFMNGRNETFDG